MDVLIAIKTRRSVRSYAARPIPSAKLERLRYALRYAPSACNLQPWRFVFVTDVALRQQLARAACDQLWLAEAPLIVVGCGHPREAYQHMGGYGNSVDMDVAIALDHLTLAAVSAGLGTCWIGAFDEARVKKLLSVPKAVKVVALTPVGYPASPDSITPLAEDDRKPAGEIFAENDYPST